jgi:hypothetical protein
VNQSLLCGRNSLIGHRTGDHIQQCSELVIRTDINKAELFSAWEDDEIPIQSIKYTVSLIGISHNQS